MKENQSGFGKIISMEIVYILNVMVLAAVACFIQFIARGYSHGNSGFLSSGDIYSYNVIMYLIGAILFIAGALILYRFIFSTYVNELAGFSIGYRIVVWIISLILALVMWYGLTVEYFLFIGFGSLNPESLVWITMFGWPVYMTGVVGVMLIRTKK